MRTEEAPAVIGGGEEESSSEILACEEEKKQKEDLIRVSPLRIRRTPSCSEFTRLSQGRDPIQPPCNFEAGSILSGSR